MKINKINIKNLRNIGSTELEFDSGINIISGLPGQGKSTLFEAIQYSLINKGRSSLKEMVAWKKKNFSIDMESSLEGEHFSSSIEYKNGSVDKTLTIDNNKENVLHNSEVTDYLKTKWDFDLLEYSVFSKQKDNEISSVTPAKRRELLKKIFNLNFTNQLNAIKEDKDENKEDILKLETELSLLVDKVFTIKDTIVVPFSKEEILLFEKEIDLLTTSLTHIEETKTRVQTIRTTLDTKKRTKSTLETTIEDSKKAILVTQDQVGKEESTEVKDPTPEVKARLKEITKQLEVEEVILPTKPEPSLRDDAKEELSRLKNEYKNTEDKIKLHQQGKCPTCENEFTSHDIDIYEKRSEVLSSEIILIEKKIACLEEESKIYTLIERKIADLTSKKFTLEMELDNALTKVQSFEETKKLKLEGLEKDITHLEEKITSNTSLLDDIVLEIVGLDKELSTMVVEDSNDIKVNLTSLKEKVREYNSTIDKNVIIEEQNKETIKSKKRNQRVVKTKQKQVNSLKDFSRVYKEAQDFFNIKFPNFVISKMLETIKNTMNKFMIESYDSRYIIDIKEDKNKKGIEILYSKDGEHWADVRNLSGFESSIVKVAWMFGLNMLSDLGIFFADEVDDACPPEYAERLYDVIGDFGKHFEQIFLISHKEEVRKHLLDNYGASEFKVEGNTVTRVN